MTLAARIPLANVTAANASLEAAGYGPRNFSVPVYTTRAEPTYATLHAWGSDLADFYAAVKALPNCEWSEATGTPQDRASAAMAGISGQWQPQSLEGQITAGNLYADADGGLWWSIQNYDASIWPDPTVIPALIRRARVPGDVQAWVQPIDAFDAYKLVNPFTGEADQASHNGETWRVVQADGAGNNVWAPGVFGWEAI